MNYHWHAAGAVESQVFQVNVDYLVHLDELSLAAGAVESQVFQVNVAYLVHLEDIPGERGLPGSPG